MPCAGLYTVWPGYFWQAQISTENAWEESFQGTRGSQDREDKKTDLKTGVTIDSRWEA